MQKTYIERRLDRLMETREKEHIPPADRGYFWKTFKELKKQGVPYEKAWYWTCLSLYHYYGLLNPDEPRTQSARGCQEPRALVA